MGDNMIFINAVDATKMLTSMEVAMATLASLDEDNSALVADDVLDDLTMQHNTLQQTMENQINV